MRSKRTIKQTEEFKGNDSPYEPPIRNSGGWSWICNPAAHFSFWRKDRKQGDDQQQSIDTHLGAQANDNVTSSLKFKLSTVLSIGIFALAGMQMFMNIDNAATYLVVNADGQTLEMAMDSYPEELAFALNAMNIGE